MKLTKKEIQEIIDSDGSLIGGKSIPTNGADIASSSNKTTDYNMRVGRQPFRYDMMGRFGFTLLPFFEGEGGEEKTKLLDELSSLMFNRYVDIVRHYNKNPKQLKVDYRKIVDGTSTKEKQVNLDLANDVLKIIEKYFKNTFGEEDIIDEYLANDSKDNLVNKSPNTDIMDKKLVRVAGLINNLDSKNKDKLFRLLERNDVK